MKNLVIKIVAFGAGVLLAAHLLSAIPLEAVSFHVWTSLVWKSSRLNNVMGSFYPEQAQGRVEQGDLGHGTHYALPKNSQWRTDPFGFRNAFIEKGDYRIVLAGDSNAVGSGVTQNEILSERLTVDTGQLTYNYSPGGLGKYFLSNLETVGIQPDIVVLELIERDIPAIHLTRKTFAKRSFLGSAYGKVSDAVDIWSTRQTLDRFLKREPAKIFESRVDAGLKGFGLPVVEGGEETLFLAASLPRDELSDEQINAIALNIAAIRDGFKSKGIQFVFLPVPNKCSIYTKLLPDRERDSLKNLDFLLRLGERLTEMDVAWVDTLSAFRSDFANGGRMYFNDDTHWNARGIRIASQLTAAQIRQAATTR